MQQREGYLSSDIGSDEELMSRVVPVTQAEKVKHYCVVIWSILVR